MRNLLSIVLLLSLLVGCSTQAEMKSELRFQVSADKSDFISWGSGGGIQGSWSGTKLTGDGDLTHQISGPVFEGAETPENRNIGTKRSAEILQQAVDAGLFDLQSITSDEADGSSMGLEAQIDGHKISASRAMTMDGKPAPKWDAVMKVLNSAEK